MACACRRGQAGIDIEKLRPVTDALRLSERFLCASEAAYLASLTEARREEAFFRLWTIKEASLKAVGHGLGFGLDNFSIVPAGERYVLDPPVEFGNRGDWQVVPLVVPAGYIATLILFNAGG